MGWSEISASWVWHVWFDRGRSNQPKSQLKLPPCVRFGPRIPSRNSNHQVAIKTCQSTRPVADSSEEGRKLRGGTPERRNEMHGV